ncbi:protein Sur7p [Diutina catenulata]
MHFAHGLVNTIFLAGVVVMMIFLVLSGSTAHSPIKQFYWLSADTSSISGAYSKSAWTTWGVCEMDGSNHVGKDCERDPIGLMISPKDNFDTESGFPQEFVESRNMYYYLSRFAFAFLLITFGLVAIVFVVSFFGSMASRVDKTLSPLLALTLLTAAAWVACTTAAVIMARDNFSEAGIEHSVSTKSMALMWTSFFLILVLFLSSVSSSIRQSFKKHMGNVNDNDHYYQNQPAQNQGQYNDQSSFTRANGGADNSGGIRFFKIKRNTKEVADDESV